MLVDADATRGATIARTDLAGQAHMPGDRHAGGVEAGPHPGHRHRPVEVVAHVLFAGPQHLDWLADLLGDRNRDRDEILRQAAAAESAAEHCLVNDHVARRHAGGRAAAGAKPRRSASAPRSRPDRRERGLCVLRLHGGVSEERDLVLGLDPPVDLGERGGNVAVLAPDPGVVGAKAGAQISLMLSLVTLPFSPSSQVMSSARTAFFARHQSSAMTATASSSCTTLRTPCMPATFEIVDRFQLAPEHRSMNERGVEHVGQAHVDAVDRLAPHLVDGVQPPRGLADERPVLRVLERDLAGGTILRGGCGDLAETDRRPLGRWVMTLFLRAAFRGRHVPLRGGRGDQHLARGGAGLAQRLLRVADRSAARPSTCRPRRGCVRRFRAAARYSVRTLLQSHSSSSATSMAIPVIRPGPSPTWRRE